MFTGIVQAIGKIVAIEQHEHFRRHTLLFPKELLSGLTLGASVAHNGCCLTVTAINDEQISFDLIKETLKVTTLAGLAVGDWVNLERSLKFGDEIGGHLLSGHVISRAEIVKIIASENNRQLWLTPTDSNLMKYILPKGFIAIDGISLTIGEVNKNRFSINLIPETLSRTTLAAKRLGDLLNLEIDSQTQAIVDTVERVLQQQHPANPTAE